MRTLWEKKSLLYCCVWQKAINGIFLNTLIDLCKKKKNRRDWLIKNTFPLVIIDKQSLQTWIHSFIHFEFTCLLLHWISSISLSLSACRNYCIIHQNKRKEKKITSRELGSLGYFIHKKYWGVRMTNIRIKWDLLGDVLNT